MRIQRVKQGWYRTSVGDGHWYHLKYDAGQWDIYLSDSEWSFTQNDYVGFEFSLSEAKHNVSGRLTA